MRRNTEIALVMLAACIIGAGRAAPSTPPDAPFRIVLTPERDTRGYRAVHVDETFPVGADGHIAVRLPSSWAGADRLADNLVGIRAGADGTHVTPLDAHGAFTASGPPNGTVTISYDVEKRWDGPPRHPEIFKPIIDETGFFLTGATMLLYPEFDDDRSFAVSLDWNDAAGTLVGSNLGGGSEHERARLRFHEIVDSIFFGGDFRTTTIHRSDGDVTLAARGSWPFSDQKLLATIAGIVGAERRFWRDQHAPPFLVTLLPDADPQGSAGGTAFLHAFALYLPANTPLGDQLLYTIAHEYFHEWNNRQIGLPPGDNSNGVAWFAEGFTDYYAYDVLLRTGTVTPAYYFRRLNDAIAHYWSVPTRNAPNAELAAHFFDEPYYRLGYERGRLIALRWNGLIRARSHGDRTLDDAMRSLRAPTGEAPRMDDQWFVQHFSPWLGPDAADEFTGYVVRGDTVPLDPDAFGRCATLTPFRYAFDAGFDFIASGRSGIMRGVERNGPAFRAGLRNNDVFRRRGIVRDADVPVVVTVYRREGGRTIRYLPRGAKLDIPQYHIGSDADFRRCMKLAATAA